MGVATVAERKISLEAEHLEDIRLAASKMTGARRRAFQAEMALKYCSGSARRAEEVFGWSRQAVQLGLHEKRTGIICLGLHAFCCGAKLWEKKHPEVAQALWELAESHAQQDPTFRTTLSFTPPDRGGSHQAVASAGICGRCPAFPKRYVESVEPQRVPVAPGAQGQTPKKVPETDAIFANIRERDRDSQDEAVMRLSMDCKATVKIGDYSRGGKTRGDHRAADHDMGCEEKHTPFGVVNEDSGSLHLSFGSSAKTSDFIIDSLYAWWERQAPEERARVTHLQIKADNGPESNGRRTQFLKRMVQFADHIGRSIRLLYYPPYHSKYNPVERCWGILEKHWNGAKLTDTQTMLEWAKTMTWKGVHPVVELSRTVYEKGVTVAKEAMQAVESRLERHPLLPKWDILIRPVSTV
jgi:hypothetical protein